MKKKETTVFEDLKKKFGGLYKTKKGRKYLLESDEIFCKPANNESSPYNDYREGKGAFDQEMDSTEPVRANPANLAEDEGLYYRPTESVDEDKLDAIKEAWPLLTEKQKRVVQMVGYEGKTLENCGAIMGISRGNVLDILNRARKIIRKTSTKG
jgi:RNA polymerase sigma factor (sigma-70 family)